jgi:hypothetical protein
MCALTTEKKLNFKTMSWFLFSIIMPHYFIKIMKKPVFMWKIGRSHTSTTIIKSIFVSEFNICVQYILNFNVVVACFVTMSFIMSYNVWICHFELIFQGVWESCGYQQKPLIENSVTFKKLSGCTGWLLEGVASIPQVTFSHFPWCQVCWIRPSEYVDACESAPSK